MSGNLHPRFFKLRSIPAVWRPNSVYYILPLDSEIVTTYVTDQVGVPRREAGGGTWEDLEGKPTSPPQDIDLAVLRSHRHENLAVLSEIGEDQGQLTYRGKPVVNLAGGIDGGHF